MDSELKTDVEKIIEELRDTQIRVARIMRSDEKDLCADVNFDDGGMLLGFAIEKFEKFLGE